MARARNIKPGFFTNEELVELPFATRLLFIGLWTLADREGRLEDKPKRIKMHLFPADDLNVDAALDALQSSGFLSRYEVDGARYIQVLAFRKHQNPHRDEKASLIPPMDGHGGSTVQAPCGHSANPADSPIPDSPIPDSSTESSAPAQAEQQPPPQQARSRDATASRLPADWMPSLADARFCEAERPDLRIDEVAARFRDYWIAQPGAKGRKTDWPATWRNWVRSEKATQQARASPRQSANANMQRLNERLNGTRNHDPDPRIIDINEPPA